MKKIYLLLVAVIVSNVTYSQTFNWVKSIGSPALESGVCITSDLSGNIYSAGIITDLQPCDFDPGPGVHNLISNGLTDVYIWKMDPAGNLVWAKSFSGAEYGGLYSIMVDAQQNIIITGNLRGTVDFDPDAGIYNLTSPAGDDVFICKLNPSGGFLWAKLIVGTRGVHSCTSTTDHLGNMYLTGAFIDSVDFDPGPGISYLIAPNGVGEIFMTKLDINGNLVWANKIGGSNWENPKSIIVDATLNIYTTGDYLNTVDFDPGPGVTNLTPVSISDIYISKYDGSGNFIWARSMGGTATEVGLKICLDPFSDLYLLSDIDNAIVDFDPGPGVFNLSGPDFNNYCITKFDSGGNYKWAKLAGGWITDMKVNQQGNIIYVGDAETIDDIDPGPGTFYFSNHLKYLAALDLNGVLLGAKPFGITATPYSLALVSNTDILITGRFEFTADMDIPNQVYITSVGDADIFVAKYSQVGLFVDNVFSKSGFTVYPNPSNGNFHIDLHNNVHNGIVEVINATGQVMLRKEIKDSNFLDLSLEAASGIYVMRVISDERAISQRIVIR